MSKKLYEEVNIQDIASAIREKNGSQNTYTVSQMGNAVRAIHADPVLESLSVTENGNYLPSAGKDGFSSVAVDVSSGGYPEPTGTIQITQNGAVNVKDYATANVNVSGGGGGSEYIEEWDLSQSLTGELHNISMDAHNTAISSAGVVFDSTNDYLLIPISWNGITIEVDVATMNLESGDHRRFIMASDSQGLIYRNTGVWGFYGTQGWATDSGETDGSFFDGCTVKVVVDANGYWHIYKDGILWWEPNKALTTSGSYRQIRIGSNDQSINNAIITGIRLS